MANMLNQLLGMKATIDALNERIVTLESQVSLIQEGYLEVDETNSGFMLPLVEIPDEESGD